MSDINKRSRLNKFDKRRKNTKYISVLIIAGSILLVILLGIWIFGGKDTENPDNTSPDTEINEDEDTTKEDDKPVEDDGTSVGDKEAEENESEEERSEDTTDEEEEVDTEQVESSDDNVAEAYTGNWEPVGTEQEGSHTTDYTDGSKDRIEIQQAVVLATKLNGDDMKTLWVGNGGDQKVIVTVSNNDETEKYRVYVSWIDNQGWQPTKVEVLKELEY